MVQSLKESLGNRRRASDTALRKDNGNEAEPRDGLLVSPTLY